MRPATARRMNIDARGGHRRQPVARQPAVTTASGHRLACYPAAVHMFIVDTLERFLLFRQPGQTGWEAVTSPLEPGETVPDAVLRAVKADLGREFLATYLGVLDTFTFVFDANLPALVSICCLLRYRGGDIRPGKAVSEAEFRWWDLRQLDDIDLAVPKGRWDLLTRAVEMSRYLRDAREPEEGLGQEFPDFP